ncbi:MAG: hypothetical protein Q7R47_01865, partial [Candidatus Diapherotrites archaeon]|nr:hypothetical protein [Candidatus Diapherotrites archaeon]
MLSGCVIGDQKNDLKEKVDSSEKVSFADFKAGLAEGKFQRASTDEPSTEYIFVPESLPYPSDESYPDLSVHTSFDVLEPGSATQEQIMDITQRDTGTQSGAVSSDVAVLLPSKQDYYKNYGNPIQPSEGPELPSEPTVDEGFAAKLETIGQVLSDVTSLNTGNQNRIEVAEKDSDVKEIIGEPPGTVVPLAFFAVKEEQGPQEMYDAFTTGCNGVHTVDGTFFNEPNKINIYSYYPEENVAIVFGFLVDPASEQPFSPSETPFENPQMNMYSDARTISTIFESQNPLGALMEAQQSGLVYLEGLDIPTSVKLMLAENALKVNGEGSGLVEENDCTK